MNGYTEYMTLTGMRELWANPELFPIVLIRGEFEVERVCRVLTAWFVFIDGKSLISVGFEVLGWWTVNQNISITIPLPFPRARLQRPPGGVGAYRRCEANRRRHAFLFDKESFQRSPRIGKHSYVVEERLVYLCFLFEFVISDKSLFGQISSA